MDQIKIGAFLKELRIEKGLTQAKLAEKLNISDRSVSRWETGSTLPDISMLIELADFYEVDINEIIDGERKSENMTEDLKETLVKVTDYCEKNNSKKISRMMIVIIILSLLFVILLAVFLPLSVMRRDTDNTEMYPVYRQVYLDEKITDGLLSSYVIKAMPENNWEDTANFADFIIFSCEEKSNSVYYVYTWVVEAVYSFKDGVLSKQSGASYPCRFELTNKTGVFEIVNTYTPRDGAYYVEDVEKLFPEYLREKIYNIHEDEALNTVQNDILNEAKNYWDIK